MRDFCLWLAESQKVVGKRGGGAQGSQTIAGPGRTGPCQPWGTLWFVKPTSLWPTSPAWSETEREASVGF